MNGCGRRLGPKRSGPAILAGQVVLLVVASGACSKKTAPLPPPPIASPPSTSSEKPTINFFNAEPSTLGGGQGAVLRWSVANATQVRIDNGIGEVQQDGSREIHPGATTTYKLQARSDAGIAEATTTVTVLRPPPSLPVEEPVKRHTTVTEIINGLQDVHFDYDSDQIRAADMPTFDQDVTALKQIMTSDPSLVIRIEGHCDERGSAEYNLGLGDRRAAVVKQALVNAGISAGKLEAISYGKERLLCLEETESCHARNRRAHFAGQ